MLQQDMLTVGSLLLSLGAFSWLSQSQASEPQVKPGEKVIALDDTHVQVGTEKLAAVEAGTELIANIVRDDWVAVTVEQESKEVSGWIHSGHLITEPEMAFAALAVRVTRSLEWLTKEDFRRIDTDADGWLTLSEFLGDTKRQTLDDLNEQLHQELAFHDMIVQQTRLRLDSHSLKSSRHSWLTLQNLHPTRSVLLPHQAFQTADLTSPANVTFKSWERKPFRHEAEQMAEDFLRTQDIRRSRVAQQLVDHENTDVRARKARALFKWGDKNHDGNLSLDEFKQALAKPNQGG